MDEQALLENEIDKKQLDAANWLIKSLLLLLKTYGLYSEYHPFCEKTLKEFHTKLISFLKDYGSFLLKVEKSASSMRGRKYFMVLRMRKILPFHFFGMGLIG